MKEIIKPRKSQSNPTEGEQRTESKKSWTREEFLRSIGLDPDECKPLGPIEL